MKQIGPYQVLEELARGGQGAVLKAKHASLGTPVAIKLLLSPDVESRARFRQEAKTLACLRHPNLLRVEHLGELPNGTPYLAMEFVSGQDVADWVRTRGIPSLQELAAVLGSLAETLHYCHEQGIVHRDVKPQNVMLEEGTGRVLLVDFGLIKRDRLRLAWSTQDRQSLTEEGTTLGTPAYMPPEQVDAEFGQVDQRSDVYALGALLYFLLTGEKPFGGPTALHVIYQVMEAERPDPRALNPTVPTALAELGMRSMSKDMDDRPESAQAFVDELREVLVEPALRPGSGRTRGALRRAGMGGAALLVLALVVGGALGWAAREPTGMNVASSPDPHGSAEPSRSPSPLAAVPAWYRATPNGERAPLPLPADIRFGDGPREYVNRTDTSVLVWVPAGSFAMGSEEGRGDEKPVRIVTFAQGYFMGKHETTWRQYEAFCRASGRATPSREINLVRKGGIKFMAGDEHPVFNVSWDDAVAYCRWAGLRLPSEAEWEYAARGPTSATWPWGEDPPGGALLNLADQSADWDWPARTKQQYRLAKAKFRDGFSYTAPIGSYPEGASPFGCLDLAGNVQEWVRDAYVENYAGAPRDGRAVDSAGASQRVIRGGTWGYGARYCRSAGRDRYAPGLRSSALGFRPARSYP